MGLNTRGLINICKRLSLKDRAYSKNIDILCLCETWLDESFVDIISPSIDFNSICGKDKIVGSHVGAVTIERKNIKFSKNLSKLDF